jgi:hypothetical protein
MAIYVNRILETRLNITLKPSNSPYREIKVKKIINNTLFKVGTKKESTKNINSKSGINFLILSGDLISASFCEVALFRKAKYPGRMKYIKKYTPELLGR